MVGSEGLTFDVFLAHASPDKDWARALYRYLDSCGVRVCFDEAVLQPGDEWDLLLPSYLRASAIVVALVSEHTPGAWYERSEIARAVHLVRQESRRLVPVHLKDGLDPAYGTEMLHRIEWFDRQAVSDIGDRITALLRDPSGIPTLRPPAIWCSEVPAVPQVFVGRDDLVRSLADVARTATGERRVLATTIDGLGGVGKTTVAAAVAHTLRDELDVVWWVRAETESKLQQSLQALGVALGLPSGDDVHDAALRVVAELSRTPRSWLVVFDNAVSEEGIFRYLPDRGRGLVLVTSRRSNFDRIGTVVDVDVLNEQQATELLLRRTAARNPAAGADRAGVAATVRRVAGLPLALEQAAAWVNRDPTRTFLRWAALFDDAAKEPFPDGTAPLGYEHTATSTWKVSIDAAEYEVPGSATVMAVLSYLSPDPIRAEWLATPSQLSGIDLDEALSVLHGYSLLTRDTAGTLTVHRVVQAAGQRRLRHASAAEAAIAVVGAATSANPANPQHWPTLQAAIPHALAVGEKLSNARPQGGAQGHDLAQGDEAVQHLGRAVNRAGLYYLHRADHVGAIASNELSERLALQRLGEGNPDTLTARANLASSYRQAGRTNDAITLEEQVLADSIDILGERHPNTLTTRANLAHAYRSARRNNDAERIESLGVATAYPSSA